MQRIPKIPVLTAILAILLMVTTVTNPYLGIHQAQAFDESKIEVEADLDITEYDFLPEDSKARLDEFYAQLTDSVEKIADSSLESRFFVPETEDTSNEELELNQAQPTPTSTHFTQIASTSIETSVILGANRTITPTPTETPLKKPITSTPVDIQSLIDTYAPQYGADPSKMAIIAKCESGYRPDAVSPSGRYVGLYQFVDSTWVSNRNAMGLDPDPSLRANPEEAIKTAAFKMGRDGYGAWPVCGKN